MAVLKAHNCYTDGELGVCQLEVKMPILRAAAESLEFMRRLLERSGTGESTHWPPTTVKLIRPEVRVL